MSRQSLEILIIESCAKDRAKLGELLRRDADWDYRIREAESGADGAAMCFREQPDCVLLGQNHLTVLNAINPDARHPLFPVVIVLDAANDSVALKALTGGAQNYLVRSDLTAAALTAAVRDALETVRFRRLQKQNEEISKRYRLLADASRDLMLFLGADGQIVEANRAAAEVYGWSRDELLSKNFEDLCAGESWTQIGERLRRAQPPGTVRLETAHRRRDGSMFPVEASWSFAEIDGERFILGIIRDVTERKKEELELLENRLYVRQIIEIVPSVVYVRDLRERKNIFVNRAAIDALGYTHEELTERDADFAASVMHPDDFARVAEREARLESLTDGETVEFEYRMKHKSGDYVWFFDRARVFRRDDQGKPIQLLGVATDINSRKRQEQNLSFLGDLQTDCARLSTEREIFETVAARVTDYLKLSQCLFAEIDETGARSKAFFDPRGAATENVAAHSAFENFYTEAERAAFADGKPVVIDDVRAAVRPFAGGGFEALEIRALLTVSYLSGGRERLALSAQSSQTRRWREDELELLQEIAARVYLWLERARADERFRLLTENLDNVFWIFNWKQKRAEYVSPAFNRLYGDKYARSLSVKFENWTDIIHDEDRDRVTKDFFDIAQTDKYESIYRIVTPDGAIRWRHAKGLPIRDETGEILRVVGVTEDITDRKLAENQIRESEERLRLATDAAEMFSWENDLVSQKVKWSDNAAKIIGCEKEELPDNIRNAMFFVAPEEHARLDEDFRQALADGKTNYVSQFRGTNGADWQVHISIVRDAQGKVAKVVGVTQNITERKRAERRIETANYRFRVAEAAAKGFNYEWNLRTGEVTRSESITRVLGYKRTDLEKTWQAWAELIHPDDGVVTSEAEALKMLGDLREETFAGEYRVRHKNGHYVWLMERGLLIRDRDGNPHRIIGQTMDITERKEAQDKLLQAERRAVSDYRALLTRIAPLAQTLGTARELTTVYRALLDFIRFEIPCEGFLVSFYDPENQLKHVRYVWSEGSEIDARAMQPVRLFRSEGANSRAIREERSIISTRELEKMNGNFQIIGEKDVPFVESLVTPMIVMGRVIGTLEVQNHEEKYVQEHVVALEMAASLAAVAIENVRLMSIESDARAAAEEANRAKDEFLAMLSHELRSPLNAMYGWIQILQTTNPNAEQTEKAIEIIARNVRLQRTLIEDLLDVSRIISGKMQLEKENVELAAIVREAVDETRPAAEKQRIEIWLDMPDASHKVYGDRHRLQQIVGNLLTNAVKFTPDEGVIKITLKQAGGKIRLLVEDNGIGIAPALLPHIFDRFRQADSGYKRKYGGLGLGLTIVKHLTELHGGTVTAFSEGENRGAKFVVELPLTLQTVYPANLHVLDSSPATLSDNRKSLEGARILTVDDDRDVLDLISFVLRAEGAVVTCCESVREALALLEKSGDFDLLISDLGMSELDGFDLIQKLRETENGADRPLPAIALTGFVSAQDRRRVFDAGFQTHLSKPVDLDRLLSIAVGLVSK